MVYFVNSESSSVRKRYNGTNLINFCDERITNPFNQDLFTWNIAESGASERIFSTNRRFKVEGNHVLHLIVSFRQDNGVATFESARGSMQQLGGAGGTGRCGECCLGVGRKVREHREP